MSETDKQVIERRLPFLSGKVSLLSLQAFDTEQQFSYQIRFTFIVGYSFSKPKVRERELFRPNDVFCPSVFLFVYKLLIFLLLILRLWTIFFPDLLEAFLYNVHYKEHIKKVQKNSIFKI